MNRDRTIQFGTVLVQSLSCNSRKSHDRRSPHAAVTTRGSTLPEIGTGRRGAVPVDLRGNSFRARLVPRGSFPRTWLRATRLLALRVRRGAGLAQGVEAAGSLDLDPVLEVMHRRRFDTVLGRIGFDENGDVTGFDPWQWYVWKGGDYDPAGDLGN